MEEVTNGIILKVCEKDGVTAKAIHRWNRKIEFLRGTIAKGMSAIFCHTGIDKMIVTSHVEDVKEDENNLIITTENSIYYIKKFI